MISTIELTLSILILSIVSILIIFLIYCICCNCNENDKYYRFNNKDEESDI